MGRIYFETVFNDFVSKYFSCVVQGIVIEDW